METAGNKTSLVLYVAENCHDCHLVVSELEKTGVQYKAFNVDKENVEPPMEVFAYPAMFDNGKLIGYGMDIVEKLRKRP